MASESEIVDGLMRDADDALARGAVAKATALYQGLLALAPDEPRALRKLGALALNAGNAHGALMLFERAKAKGLDPDLCHAIAAALRTMGEPKAASAALNAALSLDPRHAPALYDRALELQQSGNLEAARDTYTKLAELGGGHYKGLLNQGAVLFKLGDLIAAERWFQAAGQVNAAAAAPFINLGMVYRIWGFLPQAIACLEQACALEPQNPDAHWNLANALLVAGDFTRGFAEYEWRFRRPGREERAMTMPRWKGEALANKTMLLATEQGMGDLIQFVRFADALAHRGVRVVVECHPGLESLISTAPGVARTVAFGTTVDADVYLPIASLPHMLGVTLENVPAKAPYLEAGAPVALPGDGFRIGLVWRGNPTHENDQWRSVPLTLLDPLLSVPGVQFVSLQLGEGAAEQRRGDWPARMSDLAPQLTDFAATAAVVKALDLVITVDTAVAHLAGALGKPVWVLIAQGNDWRWLHEREDTPWYPSMRLFRQRRHRNWNPTIRALTEALTKRAASGG